MLLNDLPFRSGHCFMDGPIRDSKSLFIFFPNTNAICTGPCKEESFPSRLTGNTISFKVSPQDIYAEDEEVFRKRGVEKRQQQESRQRGYQQQQRQEEQPRYRDSSEGQGRRRFVDMEKEAVSAIYLLTI